jgi:hypothetical protein
LELLVAIAVVGVLLSLLLPAVMYARESGRKAICANQLYQIGLAVHQHHNWRERLPPAWRVAAAQPEFAYGWATFLLPSIEGESSLAHLDQDSAPSATVIEAVELGLMLCPSDVTEPNFDLYASTGDTAEHEDDAEDDRDEPTSGVLARLPTANYVGVYGTVEADEYYAELREGTPQHADGAIVFDRVVRFSDLARGLSKTLLVGERTMATVPSSWLGTSANSPADTLEGLTSSGPTAMFPSCRRVSTRPLIASLRSGTLCREAL